MKTLLRDAALTLWDKYWDDMSQEWFKVEVLQDYSGEDDGESLRAWKAGDKSRSQWLLLESVGDSTWAKSCQSKVQQGVKLIRLHVVEQPYTPYVEWELMAYKLSNIPDCGENVFLVPREKMSGLALPEGDFMIFDDKRVVVNAYNNTGFMVKADFYDTGDGDDITEYLELRAELNKWAERVF